MSTQIKTVAYNGVNFEIPQLSRDGAYFQPCVDWNVWLNTVWDTAHFGRVNLPLSVGHVAVNSFVPVVPRVLDLPIKFPGSDYRVPQELAPLEHVIRAMANQDIRRNLRHNDYHAYLTVDQGWVNAGETQRKPGLHVDGFQGARIQPKVMIDHSYIVSDCIPTAFYGGPFEVEDLDDGVHNFFLAFERQASEHPEMTILLSRPFEVLLLDAYCVHAATRAPIRTYRTFVRLSYSVRQFDRLGNTHNPMFDYDWEMVARDTPANLT